MASEGLRASSLFADTNADAGPNARPGHFTSQCSAIAYKGEKFIHF